MSYEERKAREKAVDEQGLFEKYGLKPGDHVLIVPKIGSKKSKTDGLTGRIFTLSKRGVCVTFDETLEETNTLWFSHGWAWKIPG